MKFLVELLSVEHCHVSTLRRIRNLSALRARKIAERHARRGVKLFGGGVHRMNWGARGGVFPHAYRIAVIKPENGE